MIVRDLRLDGTELSAELAPEGGAPARLRYRLLDHGQAGWLAPRGDAFLAAALPLAMATGEPLRVEAPVSPRLLASAGAIMALLEEFAPAWRMRLRPVEVVAASESPAPGGEATGTFFSGGVDSFFTLLRQPETPSHLLFVHGFDIDLANTALFGEAAALVRRVASETGATPVLLETNIRELSDPHVHWELFHGPALASVALALGGLVERCLVPAGYALSNLRPWGSHPQLDPLWSTEGTELVHDGAETMRLDKIRTGIAPSQLALDTLRVCWKQEGGALNCGRCEKCLMVMSALEVCGALERSATFPPRVDPALIGRTDLSTRLPYLRALLGLMDERGYEGPLRPAIARALRRGRPRAAARRALAPLRRIAG